MTHSISLDPTRFDGNNVRLDHEITALEENNLHQQLVTEALNAQYRQPERPGRSRWRSSAASASRRPAWTSTRPGSTPSRTTSPT
ncbi:MAG: hypothetical protein R2710_12390 [Acidimicrobiales bacterium]